MKKVLSVVILLVIIFTGCSKNLKSLDNINHVSFNDKIKELKKGDEIVLNYWSDDEATYNGKEIKNVKFYNDIKINDSISEIIKKMDLKAHYALINSEIPTKEHDGTTEIIDKEFIDEKSFDFDYLDSCIIIAYENKNGNWEKLNYDEINKYFSDLENGKKIKKNIIIYRIDICGMEDETVEKGKVISIDIEYIK